MTRTITFEELERHFNTVGAFWHDAYAEWQVVVDPQRRTFDMCRYVGWGASLADAVANLPDVPNRDQNRP